LLNRSLTLYPPAYEDGTDSVPKCWHLNYRRQGITQKKAHDSQNTTKVRNQEHMNLYENLKEKNSVLVLVNIKVVPSVDVPRLLDNTSKNTVCFVTDQQIHINKIWCIISYHSTSFVVLWSDFLTTDNEVLGSIPGSTMGIFP
jgi:hypothetical protein